MEKSEFTPLVTEPGRAPLKRCGWAEGDVLITYHDNEYGSIKTGDKAIFEQICLDIFGSGSVKRSIIEKRETLRDAFCGYDIETCAGMSESALKDAAGQNGLNPSKTAAIATNARASLEIIKENGGLFKYLYGFKRPEGLLCALKDRGFTQIGQATATGIMKSLGIIEAHEHNCFMKAVSPEEY